jgi:hypothetical protein
MKNKKGQEWLRATATLKEGRSYGLPGQSFVKGCPTTVNSLKVRNALAGNPAFHLVDFWEPLPKSEPVEEEKLEPAPEPKEAPKTEPPKEKTPKLSKVKVKRVDKDK